MAKPNLYLKLHLQSHSNESTQKLKLFAIGMYYPIVVVLTGWSTPPGKNPYNCLISKYYYIEKL